MRNEMGIQTGNNRVDRNFTDIVSRLERLEKKETDFPGPGGGGSSDLLAIWGYTATIDNTFEMKATTGVLPWAVGDTFTINFAVNLVNSAYVDPDNSSSGLCTGGIVIKRATLTTFDCDMSGSGFSLISDDMGGTPAYTSAALSARLQTLGASSIQTLTFANHFSITAFVGSTPDIQITLLDIGTWLASGTISVNATKPMMTS